MKQCSSLLFIIDIINNNNKNNLMKTKRNLTIDKIITDVDCKFGAPLGRSNVGVKPNDNKIKVFDCAVKMYDGAYDKGGVYWGIGKQLRVQYTKDLSYIRFYRIGDL